MKKALLLASLAVLSFNASATEKGAISGKVSTLGLGVEYTVPVNPQVEVGAAINYFNYDRSYNSDDIDYDANARLLSFGAVGYFFPWQDKGFNVNAGLFYNGNKVTLDAKANQIGQNKVFKIQGNTYRLDQINDPHGEVSFNKISPYLGIGWKSGDRSKPGWAFDANLGVMFHGTPDVTLDATCKKKLLDSNDPINKRLCAELQKNVDDERKDVQNDIEKYRFYPVASIGFIYRF